MVESIQNIFIQVSDFLWSYIIISVLIFCAVFFTWRTRFVQFRLIKEMVRLLLHPDKVQPEEIGHDELSMDVKVDGEMKHISSFQAFVVALASRIGTGNLAGVATAISVVDQELCSGCGCLLCWVRLRLLSNLRLPNSISERERLLFLAVLPII